MDAEFDITVLEDVNGDVLAVCYDPEADFFGLVNDIEVYIGGLRHE